MSRPGVTTTFICKLQVRVLVQVDLEEAYFIKFGLQDSLHHLRWDWLCDTRAVP